MIRRVFWVGVGAGLAVVVIVRGKRIIARYTPAGVADQAQERVQELSARTSGLLAEMRAEFTRARTERERELLAALLADGQEAPEVVRARRTRERRAPTDAWDEDEDELGYSF